MNPASTLRRALTLLVQDSNGKLLDGGKKYTITFAKGHWCVFIGRFHPL